MVSCQKGPTRHAYAWQIGPFWQDTLVMCLIHRTSSRMPRVQSAHSGSFSANEVAAFLSWSSIAQFVSRHSICWRFGSRDPGFDSCIQQSRMTCLLWQWGRVGWMLADHRDGVLSSSYLAWFSIAQSVCQRVFSLQENWFQRPWFRILHSAEEDNFSPFDLKITWLCQSVHIINNKWVRSRNCDCLVTWFCYQLISKPGNKTAAVSWPDPNMHDITMEHLCHHSGTHTWLPLATSK